MLMLDKFVFDIIVPIKTVADLCGWDVVERLIGNPPYSLLIITGGKHKKTKVRCRPSQDKLYSFLCPTLLLNYFFVLNYITIFLFLVLLTSN